MRKDLEPGRRG